MKRRLTSSSSDGAHFNVSFFRPKPARFQIGHSVQFWDILSKSSVADSQSVEVTERRFWEREIAIRSSRIKENPIKLLTKFSLILILNILNVDCARTYALMIYLRLLMG